jgi:uncharacterized Zn-finger protein
MMTKVYIKCPFCEKDTEAGIIVFEGFRFNENLIKNNFIVSCGLCDAEFRANP